MTHSKAIIITTLDLILCEIKLLFKKQSEGSNRSNRQTNLVNVLCKHFGISQVQQQTTWAKTLSALSKLAGALVY